MLSHQRQWEFLRNKFESGCLGHAYLFSGQHGIGKKQFAKELVKLVSGNIGTWDVAIEKEIFPDLLIIKSQNSESSLKNEKDMMEIDISQIRQLNYFLSYKSYYGGYKTVVIHDAERMNQEAQSCLLKTLEEPKGKTLIILLAQHSELVLPTILSRCQSVAFFPEEKYKESKEEQELLQELLPVLHAELAVKFQYAKKTSGEVEYIDKALKVLQRYFRNILLAKLGVLKEVRVSSEEQYSIEKIQDIIRLIASLHTQLLTTNVNSKLALEILLLEL